MATTTTKMDVVVAPKVSKGISTYIGFGAAALAAVGTLWAAIQDNDVATAGSAAVTLISLFKTLDGRFAQATAAVQAHAVAVAPWIDEAQAVASGTVGNAPIDEGESRPDPAF